MRLLALDMLCAAFLTTSAVAQDTLSPKTLAEIKKATVYVKIEVKGLSGSGSGFVIHSEKNTALIVTNHHVIEPKLVIEVPPPAMGPKGPRLSPSKRPPLTPPTSKLKLRPTTPQPDLSPRYLVTTLKNADVTVVFDSGAKDERTVKAEVVAADPIHDLAVLRVEGVTNPPSPIDCEANSELVETMAVYTFGFPFGKALSTGKGSPAITVGKAAVSSLRQDDDGELMIVQIEGSLNPGNSGGPIVDAKGRLVGVAVAVIRNGAGIGFAIPAAEVKSAIEGRIGGYHLVGTPTGDGKTAVEVDVGLVDPSNRIKSAMLHYVAVGPSSKEPASKASLASVPGAMKVPLAVEKQIASGKITLDERKDKELLVQVAYVLTSGKTVTTKISREMVRKLELAVTKPTPPTPPAEKPASSTTTAKVQPVRPTPPPPANVVTVEATKIIGGGGGDPEFRDEAPDGGVLIGVEIGLGKFLRTDIVKSVLPIYRTSQGETRGNRYGTESTNVITAKAKADYAVGGLTFKTGPHVNGVLVTFMRVQGAELDPNDSYTEEILVGKGNRANPIGGDGALVIGIVGRTTRNDACSGVGLLLRTVGPAAAVNPAFPDLKRERLSDAELQKLEDDLLDPGKAGGAASRLMRSQIHPKRQAEILTILETLVADKQLNIFLRCEAAKALGAWGTPETVNVLAAAAKENNIFLGGAIMASLGFIPCAESAEVLVTFLPHEIAVKQLVGMGPVAEKAVTESLVHKNVEVRLAGCKILKAIGTTDSVPALEKAMAANMGTVRLAAQLAVSAIRSSKKE